MGREVEGKVGLGCWGGRRGESRAEVTKEGG